jgi:glutamyl endopeptidase
LDSPGSRSTGSAASRSRYDDGAIKVRNDLGAKIGWASVAVLEDSTLVGAAANISGYPGDKRDAEDGTQWYDAREIQSVDEYRLHYAVDTWGGQSGSAVQVIEDGDRLTVGVHTYGDSRADCGTRHSRQAMTFACTSGVIRVAELPK